jgi:hypothetical protein
MEYSESPPILGNLAETEPLGKAVNGKARLTNVHMSQNGLGCLQISAQSVLAKGELESVVRLVAALEGEDPLDHRRRLWSEHELWSPIRDLVDVKQLALEQEVFHVPRFTSHRKLLGPFIICGKSLIARFFNYWLRICLGKQLVINQSVFNLALSVLALEARVRELEESLRSRK